MKTIPAFLLLFIFSFSYAQTTVVNIDAVCVAYNAFYNKAFVAVNENDPNYSNTLLQLDPYSGSVEKSLPLSGMPKSIELTPDNKHLYLSYQSLSKINKIDLENFQIIGTVSIGNFELLDFAILPQNENMLFVIRGDDGYPDDLVMYKNGILQPKQVDCRMLYTSEICVKNDGSRLYVHDGISSLHSCHLMNVVGDGIEYDGIEWEQMVRSFLDVKNHNDLIYGGSGHIVDAFSDSIPITKAILPVFDIVGNNWRTGFDYSEILGCYVYGHVYDDIAYLSFFDGQYYNYLGSSATDFQADNVSDIGIVDENHFILIAWDSYAGSNSILFHTVSKNMVSLKAKTNNSEPATKKWHDKYK